MENLADEVDIKPDIDTVVEELLPTADDHANNTVSSENIMVHIKEEIDTTCAYNEIKKEMEEFSAEVKVEQEELIEVKEELNQVNQDGDSIDSDQAAALGHVEACLQENVQVKTEDEEKLQDVEVKMEHDMTVTETHLISNKMIDTVNSTVTHDGYYEPQTTKTLVMEILPIPHNMEDFNKINNPEEILPTCNDSFLTYDNTFQLNSITGDVLPLEQEARLLEIKPKFEDEVKYICKKCDKPYKSHKSFMYHLQVHRTVKKRRQGQIQGQKTRKQNKLKKLKEIGDMEYDSALDFEQDQDVAEKEGYKCTCGKVFRRRSRMETCLRSHGFFDSSNCFSCMSCSKNFKDKAELALHRKRLHKKKRFPCKFCPTYYNTRKELFKHLQIHQQVQLTEYKVISQVVKGKQKLKCFMCSTTFSELPQLISHVLEEHKEPYSCKHCEKTFSKIISFADHTKVSHPEVQEQAVLEVLEAFCKLAKAWKCEECGVQFYEADKLALHQVEQHSPDLKAEPQFQCTDCKRVFVTQKGLTSHKRVHHSTDCVEDAEVVEKGIMCLECRKMCSDMEALTSHMRLHSPDRKYPCKFCDFRFATPEKRKTHAEIHTGIMKYVCFICEYQCSSENRLKHHKSSVKHLSMKEYLLTGKPLIDEQSTSKEVKKEKEWGSKKRKKEKDKDCSSSDSRYPCDICGDEFSSEKKMLRHKETHPFIEFPNDDKPSRIFFK